VSEIRVDPLSGLRVIAAPDRAARDADQRDPFAEGNESLTPPELYAIRPDGSAPDTPGWRVRAFPNRFPALTADPGAIGRDARPDLFTAARAPPGRGAAARLQCRHLHGAARARPPRGHRQLAAAGHHALRAGARRAGAGGRGLA
jgi:galactose-1-phosphate uridylyltransferase